MADKQKLQDNSYNYPYHYLDLKSDEYRLIYHVEYLSYLAIVKDLLRPFTGQSLLDAGCGDGRLCYELRNENMRITGVDVSERAIAFARAFNPKSEFRQEDLRNFKSQHLFDQIVLIETLEHIPPEDAPVILKNLCRSLKDDGKLIIGVPTKRCPLIPKHYRHFDERDLKAVTQDEFEIIECIGYSKAGYRRKLYSAARRIADPVFSLVRKTRPLIKIYECLNKYYEKYLSSGDPEECYGIITVCKKTKLPAVSDVW